MAYLTSLSHSDLKVAFRAPSEAQFFNVEIVPASGIRYEVDRYLEMLRTLGIKSHIRNYTMSISDAVIEKARALYLPGIRKRKLVGFDLTREIVGDQMNQKSAESYIKTIIQEKGELAKRYDQ